MHNSQVQSSYNHFHYIYLSPPTAAHRLNILVKFFGPAGVQTPVYKQCTNLQIFRYLDRQKTGRQKKMAARTICGGYATIECYLKLTSPGSGLSCLPALCMFTKHQPAAKSDLRQYPSFSSAPAELTTPPRNPSSRSPEDPQGRGREDQPGRDQDRRLRQGRDRDGRVRPHREERKGSQGV